jgi:hypothetical protein
MGTKKNDSTKIPARPRPKPKVHASGTFQPEDIVSVDDAAEEAGTTRASMLGAIVHDWAEMWRASGGPR